jgi:hypothetical protein
MKPNLRGGENQGGAVSHTFAVQQNLSQEGRQRIAGHRISNTNTFQSLYEAGRRSELSANPPFPVILCGWCGLPAALACWACVQPDSN